MAWYRCIGGGSSPTPTAEAYIYNVGQCAFNTGYIPKTTTEIRMKAIPTLYSFNSTSGYNTMFGSCPNGDANKYKRIGFNSTYNNNIVTFTRSDVVQSGHSPWSDTGNTDFLWLNVPNIFHISGYRAEWWRVDDTSTINAITVSDTTTMEDGTTPIALFANNYNTGTGYNVTNYGNMLLYYFEIYESGVLLHKFIPAYYNSQYCLYDMINQTYIYDTVNSGNNVRGFIPS